VYYVALIDHIRIQVVAVRDWSQSETVDNSSAEVYGCRSIP